MGSHAILAAQNDYLLFVYYPKGICKNKTEPVVQKTSA